MARFVLLLLIGCVAAAASVAAALNYEGFYDDDDDLLGQHMQPAKKNHECASASKKCFNSGQCCDGLVCAAFDKDIGDKPEVPGYCVKSKDLQVCTGSDPLGSNNCPEGTRCATLGRMGQKYCLPRREEVAVSAADSRLFKLTDRRRYLSQASNKASGRLGTACVSDADCSPRSEDGLHKMCCQQVTQGRQGTKRICDRVTPISNCIVI